MKKRTLTTDLARLLLGLAAAGSVAHAAPAVPDENAAAACANVTGASGLVQILDESRTRISEVNGYEKESVPCGGWISLDRGWARLQLRSGATIHIGHQSFAQIRDSGVVLFRGEIYAEGKNLALSTPNSDVTVGRGAALVFFETDSERTEVVALDGATKLENRFVGGHPQALKAGELSHVNFDRTRVLPSAPQPMLIPSLQAKLTELRVPVKAQAAAIRRAQARAKAIKLKPVAVAEAAPPTRAPAGLEPDRGEEKKSTPPAGKKLAAARRPIAKPRPRPAAKPIEAETKDEGASADEAEKRRLIDELSALKTE